MALQCGIILTSQAAIPVKEGDTPFPLAYCVSPDFGLAYCVPPLFGIAYCVLFNNKTKKMRFICVKKIK